jgi:hypothetical protein
MFEWLKGKENAEIDSADSSTGPTSNLRLETSESAKVIQEVSKRKRTKDDSGGGAFTFAEKPSATTTAAIEAAKILDAILDPKVWRGAVAAPGDMMVAVTGKKHWELSDDERDTLAKTGAATARCFAVTDPKWLALSLFSFSVISIYGGRLLKDFKDRVEEKKKNLPAVIPHA